MLSCRRERPASGVGVDDLAAPAPRAITDGPFGSNLKSNHYTDSGARVIRLQNIGDGDFRDDRAYVDLERFEQLRAHEVRQGDLVIASLGDSPPRACLVPELSTPAIVKADCIRVRLSRHVLPEWVLYTLISPATKSFAKSAIKGVGRPRLGLGLIRNLAVPLPPRAEQYRIVDQITALLTEIDYAQESLTSGLRKLPSAFGSTRAQLTNRVGTEGVLADVLERIEAGRSLGGPSRPAMQEEWGIIKVSAMTWGRFKESENKYVDSGAVDQRHEIRPGNILVSRANTQAYVGAPVLVGEVRPRLLLSDKSLRLVPRTGVDPGWLLHVLASPAVRSYISRVATGTKDSMRNISQAALLRAPIRIPDPTEQQQIAREIDDRLSELRRLDLTLNAARKRAEELRRSVLADAFAGRLIPQDPGDEPASELLQRIRSERPSTNARTKGVG